MQGDFLNSIIDLNEATKYQVTSKEENSIEWFPQRGLRGMLNLSVLIQCVPPGGNENC